MRVWMRCRRCRTNEVLTDELAVGWCQKCLDKATELHGRLPFVIFKPHPEPTEWLENESGVWAVVTGREAVKFPGTSEGFQQAIDYLSGPGKLFIGPGTYICQPIPRGVSLEGCGADHVRIKIKEKEDHAKEEEAEEGLRPR